MTEPQMAPVAANAAADGPAVCGFWSKLTRRPFSVLAPMANVTDVAFRHMWATYGKPDVMYTEFVSVEGLCSAGRPKLLIDLLYEPGNRPIVAQLFGNKPEQFEKIAKLVASMGFDGVDLNFGCPDKNITGRQGAGAALILDPPLAKDIVLATKAGAGNLPVSVKTRLGYNSIVIDEWVQHLLVRAQCVYDKDLTLRQSVRPAAIILHGRTKKEMSLVPAHWDEIGRTAKIVKESNVGCLFVGNGDVASVADGEQKAEQYGVDGVMLGRACFGNPWVFNASKPVLSTMDRLLGLLEHTAVYHEWLGAHKPFSYMRKHYQAYVSGFGGSRELRSRLLVTSTPEEAIEIVRQFASSLESRTELSVEDQQRVVAACNLASARLYTPSMPHKEWCAQ